MGGFCFLFHWTSKFSGRGSQPEWGQPETQEELFTPRQVPGTLSCQYKSFQIVSASLMMITTENASTPLSAQRPNREPGLHFPGYNKIPRIFYWCGWRHSGWSLEFDLIQETITLHTLKKSRMSSPELGPKPW